MRLIGTIILLALLTGCATTHPQAVESPGPCVRASDLTPCLEAPPPKPGFGDALTIGISVLNALL